MRRMRHTKHRHYETTTYPDGSVEISSSTIRRKHLPGFWCPTDGEVEGVKVTHPWRNWGSRILGGWLGWAIFSKVEQWHCPVCGNRVYMSAELARLLNRKQSGPADPQGR